jgi:hypothetical protein
LNPAKIYVFKFKIENLAGKIAIGISKNGENCLDSVEYELECYFNVEFRLWEQHKMGLHI